MKTDKTHQHLPSEHTDFKHTSSEVLLKSDLQENFGIIWEYKLAHRKEKKVFDFSLYPALKAISHPLKVASVISFWSSQAIMDMAGSSSAGSTLQEGAN